MEKLDFINITKIAITGIRSPLLTVVGNTDDLKYDFLVKVDGKSIDYER